MEADPAASQRTDRTVSDEVPETKLDRLYVAVKALVGALRESNGSLHGPNSVSDATYERLELLQIKLAVKNVK